MNSSGYLNLRVFVLALIVPSGVFAQNQNLNENENVGSTDSDNGKSVADDTEGAPDWLNSFRNKPDRDITARLIAFYEMTNETGKPNHFELDSARLNLSWTWERYLEIALEYDFANLVAYDDGETTVKDGLKDAYIRVEPLRWLGFQVGHFKKPFSRIELTSQRKLPSITKGEANDFALDFLNYGDRDLGVMISGRLVKSIKLDYAAGVFNGGESTKLKMGTGSVDYAFRLDSTLAKWFKIGASASARVIRNGDFEEFFTASDYEGLRDNDFPSWLMPDNQEYSLAGFTRDYEWMAGKHWMGEIDLEVDIGDFEAIAESMVGKNWWFRESPYLWSVTAILSYRFSFWNKVFALEPVLFGEVMHIEDRDWTWKARMWQFAPGLNVHFGDDLRIMIHGMLVKTTPSGADAEAEIDEAPLQGFWPGEWPGSFGDSKALFVQVAFAN